MIEPTPAGERSAADIASRSIRVTLGGTEYVLAVLFIAGNERWRTYERQRTTEFVAAMTKLGDDAAEITAAFNREPDMWLDILYAYDTDCGRQPGVLPPRDVLKETIHEDEPQAAVLEVVKAANPKAVVGWAGFRTLAASIAAGSTPTSSSPTPTAGRSKKSARN